MKHSEGTFIAKVTLTQEQATLIFDRILTQLECNEGLFKNRDGLHNTDWQVFNQLIEAGFDEPPEWEKCLTKINTIKMERGGK